MNEKINPIIPISENVQDFGGNTISINTRIVIDIPKTVILFEEFEIFTWGGNMHTKNDLLMMYNKYKEFIGLSPAQQSEKIYTSHPYLNKNIYGQLTYSDVLGVGNFGIVIKDGMNSKLAYKVNKDLKKGDFEANIHNRVVALISAAKESKGSILREMYKEKYHVKDIIGVPPSNVNIPPITKAGDGVFVMKTINGESVLTKMYSSKWFVGYEGILEGIKRSYPMGYKFTDYELYRGMADIYKFGENHLKDRIRDPEQEQLKKFTTEYVHKNIPEVLSLDGFLQTNGIHQADLHGGNIIISNDIFGEIYLIDFGEAVLSK